MTFLEFVFNIILLLIVSTVLSTFLHIVVAGKNPVKYWRNYRTRKLTLFQTLILFYYPPRAEGYYRRQFKIKDSNQAKRAEREIIIAWVLVILIFLVVLYLNLQN